MDVWHGRFDWDEANEDPVAKHGFTPAEVEEALLEAGQMSIGAYNIGGEAREAEKEAPKMKDENGLTEIQSLDEVPDFESEDEERKYWDAHTLGAGILDKMERRNKLLENRAFSGKVNLRMPASLHRDLSRRAKREGASLNHLMTVLLARALESEKSVK